MNRELKIIQVESARADLRIKTAEANKLESANERTKKKTVK